MMNLRMETRNDSTLAGNTAAYNQIQLMKNSGPVSVNDSRWQAVLERDRQADGTFVFGVLSTGVYCRPSCPARRPLRKNVKFFSSCGDAEKAGLRACLRCKPLNGSSGNAKLVERLCRYMESNADQKITLASLSKVAGISRFHLQRMFTAELGISPARYLQAFRFSRFKSALRSNSVTTAWADAGYSSSSRVYETARARLGMPPGNYSSGAGQEDLRFALVNTRLGNAVLVAGAEGVCSVHFLENASLGNILKSEYPRALINRDDKGLAQWTKQLRQLIAGEKASHSIPLDIRGTAFQQKVWQQSQKIPPGQTRTYSEIAHLIGRQSAVRAVASACASNNLAVLVPCHRVVHKSGSPEGYRWGTDRKRKLLKIEAGELPK